MKLDKYIAVSGFPGLFELVSTRDNGLLIGDLDTGKTRFVSTRKHQFTPLGTIAIYTYDDSTELSVIFKTMFEQKEENPIVSYNASSSEIKSYFEKILPDYDPDRVHTSDMKKVIKWYDFLDKRGLLSFDSDEEE